MFVYTINLKPFSTPEALYVFKTLSVTVRGVNQGNFDIVCTGQAIIPVSEDTKLGSYKLDCPADPAGNVVVGTGVGPELTVSVQWYGGETREGTTSVRDTEWWTQNKGDAALGTTDTYTLNKVYKSLQESSYSDKDLLLTINNNNPQAFTFSVLALPSSSSPLYPPSTKMYALFFLLTTALLPLSILAAPTPVDPIVRVDSVYKITSAVVRTADDRSGSFTNIDFDLSIRGTKPGNIDINCVGGVDVKDQPERMQLNCPLDPGLVVWVTAGLDNGFDLTVQYL
ncbi:MAG: hypothetical protein Q9192_003426 [Flavoplaca navasiana]